MKYQFDEFIVDYDSPNRPVESFRQECILAAKKAIESNSYNLPIVVMMSGGIDSQLVAESLLSANIPFKCVIGCLHTIVADEKIIFNSHDYQYAERWCQTHNIDILYCDIDVFSNNNLLSNYVLSAKGFSPQYACHMYIMKWCNDRGYFFIAGNGEMDLVLRDNEYFMLDEQREFTLDNFCKLHNLTGIFQFWKQDSYLISAFLMLPTVKKLMYQNVERLLDYKHVCFSDAFDFEPRPKATGFEKIQQWDYIMRNHLKIYTGQYDHKYYTPISKFLYAPTQ